MTVLQFRPRPALPAPAPEPPPRPHPAVRLALCCALFPFAATGWLLLVSSLVLLDGVAVVTRRVDPGAPGPLGESWPD